MLIAKAARKLPAPVENAVRLASRLVPLRFRLGPVYEQTRKFIADSERWNIERLNEWQLAAARDLVRHAVAKVPYYREMYRREGVAADDIRTWIDWKKLPTIGKADVRDHLEAFVAEGVARPRLQYMTTGGSTGLPVGFYLDQQRSDATEWAFMYAQWERVGYRPGAGECAVFRGGFIGAEGKYSKYDPLRRETHFSSYHLRDEHIKSFLNQARSQPFQFIQAYPSALTIVAKYLEKRGESGRRFFPQVRAILLGSENVYPQQRRFLESVFDCRVYSWYGHAERLILAGECEHSNDYHVFPQYGITEVLDGRNRDAGPGQVGELIGTGLHSKVFPLIRYRTQDFGLISDNSNPCTCGRPYVRLKRIEGRLQELVVTAQGRLISMTAINMHSDVFDGVKQFQFVQEQRGLVRLLLAAEPDFSLASLEKIRRAIQEKLGPDMRLELVTVDAIPRTGAGKHRFLVQKLKMDEYSWSEAWTGSAVVR